MRKSELFIDLAEPDENGFSRWVSVDEFVGKYISLQLGNGFSWGRPSSSLARDYIVETKNDITSGNRIDAIRLVGFNTEKQFNQHIRKDIREKIVTQPCVMLGINGKTKNTSIEVDHKEGTKDSHRVSNVETQTIDDFQPLTKAANDAKRQICKKCIETDIRFDARILKGFSEPFYKGGYSLKKYGCEGCYQFDPVQYRKTFFKK